MCYETVAPFYNSIAIQYPLYIASPAAAPPPPPPPSLIAISPRCTPPQELVDSDAMVEVEEEGEGGTGEKRGGISEEGTRKQSVVVGPE